MPTAGEPNLRERCRRTRADRCPGVLRPYPAADGGLARIRLSGGRLTAGQLEALGRAAEQLGNGAVELTSRANVQLRGLAPGRERALAQLLADHGLFPSPAHDRVRNLLANPLAGRHPAALADPDPVVAALDREICRRPSLARLSGRFLFAVEDGSGVAIRADWDLAALAVPGGWQLGIAGTAWRRPDPQPLSAPQVAALVAAGAEAFLELRLKERLSAWRAVEVEGVAERLAGRLRLVAAQRRPPQPTPLVPGLLRQRDGRWAVTAVAQRLDPARLRALAALAEEGVRIGWERTVTVLDLPAERAADLHRRLREVVAS